MINEYITSYHLPQLAEVIRIYVDSKTNEIKSTTDLIYVTYEELVKLRNNSLLKPGCFYCITDYVTTTGVANTESAGYNFPIIVLATSSNTLSEEAVTTNFGAHSHFENNNLDAWKIWYCLDNDDDRFSWAGQKLRKTCFAFQISITEWFSFERDKSLEKIIDNTTYYGYKWESGFVQTDTFNDTTILWYNVEYPELTITYERVDTPVYVENNGNLSEMTLSGYFEEVDTGKIGKGVIYRMIDEFGNDCPYDFKNIKFKNPHDENDDTYYYTFAKAVDGNNISDASVNPYVCAKGNIIGGRYENSGKMMLPINIFCGRNVNILNNVLGNNCYDNIFGEKTSDNYNCQNNTFGNECHNNSFGNNCRYNTFGNECTDNSFGNDCYYNSFGNGCTDNSFGNNCGYNSFGNLCELNSFGNHCNYNSFGNSCGSNSFGNNCYSNSFGNGCGGNSFRNSASETGVLKDYCQYNHFDDGCSFNVIWNSDTTGEDILLKNINVNRGVCGTDSSYNYINVETLNSEKEININNYNGYIYIDYGGIFNVTYSELVYLRDNAHLITGRQYRIIDYVTTTIRKDTQSAGHQFDVIVTALDENTLSEEAQAIQHDGDEYFSTSNLNAWKIWYSLDNDTNRFTWVGYGATYTYDSSECTINSELIDGNSFITPFNFTSCVWVDGNGDGEAYGGESESNHDEAELVYEWGYFTDENDNTHLCLYKSDAGLYEEEGQPDYGDKYLYRGVVNVDGTDYDYWQKWDISSESVNNIDGSGGCVYATTSRIVSNPEAYSVEIINETNPKGVIYRMIDEFNNDCPYDFKNIMFMKSNGSDVGDYYFTFSWVDSDGNVNDASIVGNDGTLRDDEENIRGVYNNIIGKYIENGVNKLPVNLFISTHEYDGGLFYGYCNNTLGCNCFNNTFGEDCNDNTFGNDCYGNTLGNNYSNNTLGISCVNNTFGENCYNNTFGNNCYDNTLGNNYTNNTLGIGCYNNTFSNECINNTFGDFCVNNTFGDNCHTNSIGIGCVNNTFGNSCQNNTFGEICQNNSFSNGCCDNIFGNDCDSNTFGEICQNNSFSNGCCDNIFGNDCDSNTFGDECRNNTFGVRCNNNTFGNNCYDNTIDEWCANITFGNGCYNNTFGEKCHNNTFGDNCRDNTFGEKCHNNTFGDNCRDNTFGDDCDKNIFSDECVENTFGDNCQNNSFGNNCIENILGVGCYYNTFGDSCHTNTFGDSCTNNTLGSSCIENILGLECYNNSFGDNCQNNSFGIDCYNNTFGNTCGRNTLGDRCGTNSFGIDCYTNTFGVNCCFNTFGDVCYYNTLGDECCDNTFSNNCGEEGQNNLGNDCDNNTFGNNCHNNTLGDNCVYNIFGKECCRNVLGGSCGRSDGGNIFGDKCNDNTLGDNSSNNILEGLNSNNNLGDNCMSNIIGIMSAENIFGSSSCRNKLSKENFQIIFGCDCCDNVFGYSCGSIVFGEHCYNNTFGKDCINNTLGNECSNNTFGKDCSNNTFVDNSGNTRNYCSNNVFENNCSYNKFIAPNEGSSTEVLQNLHIHNGFKGGGLKNLKETVINKLNSVIDIDIYQDEDGNTCINQINCGTF